MAIMPDPIDHRIAADQLMRQGYRISGEPAPTEHLLAAIHDLLDERLPTKGDPCWCDVEPTEHDDEPDTLTLPRDVVDEAAERLRYAAEQSRSADMYGTAKAHDALADALDGGQS